MGSNSSFYLGSTNYGAVVDTITNPARKTNASFYPGGLDYRNIAVLIGAPLSAIIQLAGNVVIPATTNIGAAFSGTISVSGDLTSLVAWDYDAEYLLHF